MCDAKLAQFIHINKNDYSFLSQNARKARLDRYYLVKSLYICALL